MTDDFNLFQDQAGGDPVDPDIALVTAYLARELSIVQIAAVEDRLANDRAFREKTLPILEAWALPAALPAPVTPALSREEVEAGWQRYVGNHAELDAHEGPRLLVDGTQPKRRKISMTRIAAGVAAVLLPVITLAQITVYVAKKPDAPGHSVAKQLVAPFIEEVPAPTLTPQTPKKPLTTPVDVPVGRQMERKSPSVQRVQSAQVPQIETPTPAPTVTPGPVPQAPVTKTGPDRTRIAGYATKYMAELIRGDTNATYVVMVLNASDDYVWGTYGSGALQITIAGDKRTQSERNDYNRANALELTGAMPGARGGGGGGRGGVAGGGARGGGGGRGDSLMAGAFIVPQITGVARGGGGGGRARGGGGVGSDSVTQAMMARLKADTVVTRSFDSLGREHRSQSITVRPDSAMLARLAEITGGMGAGGRARAGGGGGGRGLPTTGVVDGVITAVAGDSAGPYSVVFGRAGVERNTAAGLQDPENGESGIQGLKATSLTMSEQYFFGPGQLMATPIRIVVVHLAPGTNWKGR